ncbi:uncharacterized protein LOC129602440 [Paramacrobiotus metropolitanus]|uniref:uncharacterized protein LOC129602440 n=1 Tax=Paramacrobiotus metropolitanus TaxID=2943436 RepID=UPI002445CE72|nr:uncharacterized protein LOC129602440 [Paramacrobiotus metropolitanus]
MHSEDHPQSGKINRFSESPVYSRDRPTFTNLSCIREKNFGQESGSEVDEKEEGPRAIGDPSCTTGPSRQDVFETDFYYKRKNVVVPESWQKLPRKNWPKKVMLAMGISWRGQTAMYVVPPETKVDHKVFIDLVLKPMIRKDVPRLYGSDAKKVVLHMDSAPSHVAKETVQWLKAEKVKYIPKEEWLANSQMLRRWTTRSTRF